MSQRALREKITQLRKKALSGNEILDLLDDKANLITYPELANMKTIDEALEKAKAENTSENRQKVQDLQHQHKKIIY
jgi:hypothetical protein